MVTIGTDLLGLYIIYIKGFLHCVNQCLHSYNYTHFKISIIEDYFIKVIMLCGSVGLEALPG